MKLFNRSTPATPATATRRRSRPRVVLTAGIAVAALVATGAVAQAAGGYGSRMAASTTSYSMTPRLTSTGDWSYGTWDKHAIVLPRQLTPTRGSRLTSILVGRGVLVYTCTAGTFALTEPLINLFTTAGRPTGLHFTVPAPKAPLVWGSSVDGSRADMAIVKEIPTPRTVTRVLLRAVITAGGPRTQFGATTAIVRLPVTGGVAPRTCTVRGQRLAVPFLTLYLVFKGGLRTTTSSAPAMATSNGHY